MHQGISWRKSLETQPSVKYYIWISWRVDQSEGEQCACTFWLIILKWYISCQNLLIAIVICVLVRAKDSKRD